MPTPSTTLTFPQRKALGGLIYSTTGRRTAKELFVRADVLWRLAEQGYVQSGVGGTWSITTSGRDAYDAAMARLRLPEGS